MCQTFLFLFFEGVLSSIKQPGIFFTASQLHFGFLYVDGEFVQISEMWNAIASLRAGLLALAMVLDLRTLIDYKLYWKKSLQVWLFCLSRLRESAAKQSCSRKQNS